MGLISDSYSVSLHWCVHVNWCELVSSNLVVIMSSNECHWTLLVQVMAWCRQATSHYLNQCWSRSPTPYGVTRPQWVKQIISTLILLTNHWCVSYEIVLWWMVVVMVWCCQATSHYLSQCWPSSTSPYGITWPQWIKTRDMFISPGMVHILPWTSFTMRGLMRLGHE